MAACTESLSLWELYTQLVSWEQRMDLLHGGGSSVNTTCGGRGGNNHHGSGDSRGRGIGHDNGGRTTAQQLHW